MIKLKNILKNENNKKKMIPESFSATADTEYGEFVVKLLSIRDQSHIFHWQTDSFARHEAFGSFYDEYLGLIDELVESIMGLIGRPKIGNATIHLVDYSPEALIDFIEGIYPVLGAELEMVLGDIDSEEILDQARVVLLLVDKLKYLLSLK